MTAGWRGMALLAVLLPAAADAAVPACTGPTQGKPLSESSKAIRTVSRPMLVREWKDFLRRFVGPDGRVIDNANGGISHSEGQGYGMLFAALTLDRPAFDRIWGWTRTSLLVRQDDLASWKWDPKANGVTDGNNATDGDMLIAWALGEAAVRFNEPEFNAAGRKIALSIGRNAVRQTPLGPVLMPGVDGFDAIDRPDGPVVNLSYWVFPAFSTLQRMAPEIDWAAIEASGLTLAKRAQFGPLKLPSDWISLAAAQPEPAQGFPATFGYNAIRIPMYIAGLSKLNPGDLRQFSKFAIDLAPPVIDVASGSEVERMNGPGFKAVLALTRCGCDGQHSVEVAGRDKNDFYYPAALSILSKWLLIERYPQCL